MLINELVDYGTSLVPLAFTNSPRDLKAICIIFVQLRQFLVHLDGAAILASAGNCSSATLQRRSLLETALTIEWILASDTDNRVNHLYVANLRRRCQWNRITVPGTPEATHHADAASRLALTPEQQKEISDEIARTDALLARPPFDVINAKFEPHYQRRGYDQPWHEVYGVPSIRKISDDLGRGNFTEGRDHLIGESVVRAVIANSQAISKRAYDTNLGGASFLRCRSCAR